ncbi:MAG: YgcG family protein [Sterolibacterium sp.]
MAKASLLAFILCGSCIAAAQVPVPPLTGRITDLTATLTAARKASLEQTLQAFETRKGSQLAVLIIPTTAPETIEQYAQRVAESWKPGRKKVDDGAILVIAKTDRAVRIEVGYGLEGVLNDATSKRIISEIITPRFKQGDFYGGITIGVDQIIRVIDGEPLPEPNGKATDGIAEIKTYVPVIFILALMIGGVLRSVLGRFPGALVTGGAVAVVVWLISRALSVTIFAGLGALLYTLLGGGMAGLGVGGRLGGFGRGGLGGGGFSGGGGSFGGGGATGRW